MSNKNNFSVPVIIIRRNKFKEFIEVSNKNVITEEFLKECRKSSKVIKRKNTNHL
ncbi:hypothetical protein [Clostridium perfringens]|uniref:Uncharacterized protein n=1 Tax=Clostridium perfringens TaxID=1502 RepID=A0A140GRR6_CLOPF|nr:hypothetical protein [Clostridium perfringens]AMN31225.1 hypothetical protein JFP838_pA0309 [Clostridium perfringens]